MLKNFVTLARCWSIIITCDVDGFVWQRTRKLEALQQDFLTCLIDTISYVMIYTLFRFKKNLDFDTITLSFLCFFSFNKTNGKAFIVLSKKSLLVSSYFLYFIFI